VRCAWDKFSKLAKPFINFDHERGLLEVNGKIYKACVQNQSILLYDSEALKVNNLRLERAKNIMLRWMCGGTGGTFRDRKLTAETVCES